MGTTVKCPNPNCPNDEDYTEEGTCPTCGTKLEKQLAKDKELQPGDD